MLNTMFVMPRHWFAANGANCRHTAPLRQEKAAQAQNAEKRSQGILPCVDLLANADAYSLSMEIPGVDPAQITLETREDQLVISGEKSCPHEESATRITGERVFGEFRRTWTLPEDADAESITAASRDGVLTITVPRKAAPEPQHRTIDITRQ